MIEQLLVDLEPPAPLKKSELAITFQPPKFKKPVFSKKMTAPAIKRKKDLQESESKKQEGYLSTRSKSQAGFYNNSQKARTETGMGREKSS